jgi:hypothetical protein
MISTSGQPANTPAPAPLRARILRWARGPTFARDIVIVLVIKLVLLMALKYAFFNHPQAENMSMRPADVAQAILSVPETTPPKVDQGDHHAH